MIISIASGKGGTGKTTIATNLAISLERPVTFLDCDVEEPNAYLFLNPSVSSSKKVYMPVPLVDEKKCDGCGECAKICQFKAIVVINKIPLTFPELCHGCGGCVKVCPKGAISETKREIGEMFFGKKDSIDVIWGKLRIGEPMAPPLIKEIRKHESKNGITIIDAPPGTSCPVVASVKYTDYIVLVTEPTPFGFNDLKLAIETVKLLKVPFGILINRSDLGTDDVRNFARQNNIPILMEIPFDQRIAVSYSKGIPLVYELSDYKDRFREMFEKIKEEVENKR